MLSLSAIFVSGAQQSRSSTIHLNSDVVYLDIVSSCRIINNPLCGNSITLWARTDILSRFSRLPRLSLAQEANSRFDHLRVSRCIFMAVRADSRLRVKKAYIDRSKSHTHRENDDYLPFSFYHDSQIIPYFKPSEGFMYEYISDLRGGDEARITWEEVGV